MVNLPWQRDNLLFYLDVLSDKDQQQQRWGKHTGIDDNLDFAYHFLYDDSPLAEHTEATIGDILLNHDESNLVRNLINAMDIVWHKYGMKKTDEEYINYPEWDDVVKAAKKLLILIRENDSKSKS